MIFLNPALLLGPAAVALPLLIHLFSRRRFPQIDFSSLRFLKRLQRQQMRRLKLRQWLLLLLRTFAVLLIALAFLRPALMGEKGFGLLSTGRIGMAVVVDASASMQAKNRAGSSFAEARDAVQTLMAAMRSGDRMEIVMARGEPVPLAESPSTSADFLGRELEKARVWDGSADLGSAVNRAMDALGSAQDFRREIYLFSDFASPSDLPTLPEGAIPFFVRVSPESGENLSVESAVVTSEIIEPGQPVDVEITLVNRGKRDREDVYYSVFLNGSRVAEDVVTLSAGGQIRKQHQILPQKTGLQEGVVRIEEPDVLLADNEAYFCFSVPDHVDVLLVGDSGSIRDLQLALSPDPRQDRLVAVHRADRNNWDTKTIARYDVVCFVDPPGFTDAQAARLVNYVQNGGGLLIFPGDFTDVAAVNREFLSPLSAPRWGEKLGQSGQKEAFLIWQDLDTDLPLLRGILRTGSHPSSPRFYQVLRLVGEGSEVPIRFGNGLPFLSITRVGQGWLMLCASSPDPNWSDWARKGIFPPLVHRLMLRLAKGSRELCQALQVGDDLEVRSGAGQSGSDVGGSSEAILTYPDDEEVRLPPRVVGHQVAFLEPQINPAGIYHVRAGGETYLAAVNVPPGESSLQPLDPQKIYQEWSAAGAHLTDADALAETVRKSRYGNELWKLALVVGLGVLLVESALGSTTRTTTRSNEGDED